MQSSRVPDTPFKSFNWPQQLSTSSMLRQDENENPQRTSSSSSSLLKSCASAAAAVSWQLQQAATPSKPSSASSALPIPRNPPVPISQHQLLTSSTSATPEIKPASSASLLQMLTDCTSPATTKPRRFSHMHSTLPLASPSSSHFASSSPPASPFSLPLSRDTQQELRRHTFHHPPPPALIWHTPFVHFLDRYYFLRVQEQKLVMGSTFVLPEKPTALSPPGTDPNLDYLDWHFSIVKPLGHGSFGDAHLVQQRSTGKWFALKKTRKPFHGFKDRKLKIEEVAKLWRLTPHPHLVELHQAWEQRGFLFMLMEYCEGGSLDHVLDEHADDIAGWPEQQLWIYLTDLALGLKHVHDFNIVHLDLKPSNILVTENGSLKIGDFGMAVDLLNDNYEDREGDRTYMAPELLEGNLSKAADIFSLGLILCEMAGNCTLPDSGIIYQQIRHDDLSSVPFHPDTSEEMLSLIAKMMKRDPKERPTIDMILQEPKIVETLAARYTQNHVETSDLMDFMSEDDTFSFRDEIMKL